MCLIFCVFLFLGNLFIFMEGLKDTADTDNNLKIAFVILSQPNSYHNNLADLKKMDLLDQAAALHSAVNVKVLKSHVDFGPTPGHWTVFPLFEKLLKFSKMNWIFFLDDKTHVNLSKILNVLSSYDSSHDVFAGYALRDSEPTIIHHFASSDEKTTLLYPHFSAGFFISLPLMKKLLKPCQDCQFSIDPKYELAIFILKVSNTKLTHESRLCLKMTEEFCASWIEADFPDCGPPLPSQKTYVAVKTCKKFHRDRVKVVKETWGPDVENLRLFSDEADRAIPTIRLDVENVEVGHCKKTLSIMKHYVDENLPLDWLVIVDDDTLLSFRRLQRLLLCYNSSEDVALGERYGYGVQAKYGYDYPTGGSGMIFSRPTVRKLVSYCQCPSIDSPDDMILGVCLKTLHIPVTHSPHFHQARPTDYPLQFLSPLKHVSFHKHWMIDPQEAYNRWLREDPSVATHRYEL